jgi:hypothetical protein
LPNASSRSSSNNDSHSKEEYNGGVEEAGVAGIGVKAEALQTLISSGTAAKNRRKELMEERKKREEEDKKEKDKA